MRVASLIPGIALCGVITLAAIVLQRVEENVIGHLYIEELVLAILVGTAIRTAWTPGPDWKAGIDFCARFPLEIAVALLGATVSFATLATVGWPLIAGIAAIVVTALIASYAICRALGLSRKLAILVSCGNSICGNSAIAAVAPVIGASGRDIASSIAFTAFLGVVVVLLLPLLVPLLQLSQSQYGVVAGLTVYAVPQVLAATLPIGALSNQIGTLVKLVRVLMLGPLVIVLSVFAGRMPAKGGETPTPAATRRTLPVHQFVPWFIVAFVALAMVRSAGALPAGTIAPITIASKWLTAVSMAALGLGVDLKSIADAGPRITVAVTVSLAALIAMSLLLIRVVGIH
ncbi:MAG: YeiH family protein [Xanthobacteraceae bacterium]|uniref:YeiH family protein n=1 Tax=Pseudolabrys sp. TaxID=1960880 RepID=UPI003D102389